MPLLMETWLLIMVMFFLGLVIGWFIWAPKTVKGVDKGAI